MGTIHCLRPSLRLYATGLVTLVLLAVGLFSWFVTGRVEVVAMQAESRNAQFAHQEMHLTLEEVMARSIALAERFAEWDEAVQQFSQPTYYDYWRDRRAEESRFTPAFFDAIELYDNRGEPLGARVLAGMPARVEEIATSWRLALSGPEGHAHLYLMQPVGGAEAAGQLRGYVVLALDLNAAIADIQRFRHVEAASIQVTGSAARINSAEELLGYLSYDLEPNWEFIELQRILVGALWQFGVVAAALLALALYLLVALGGMPLSRLGQHIDRLGRSGGRQAIEPDRRLLPLVEFDKVRSSLDDFHARVTASARDLRNSETRMRTILHNVVDGIITCDVEGYVTSSNAAVERLFGCNAEQLLGRHLLTLFDGLSVGELHRLATRVHADEERWASRRIELTGRRDDGSLFPAELTLSRLQLPDSLSFISVVEDISERKEAERRLTVLANYDALTGLPNRTLLRDRLDQAMRQAQRSDLLVGVLFLDLDRFKNINDTLGHHCGDQLLKVVAERLKGCVRASDTVARLGGDEFMVVVENMHHVDEAVGVAQKIRACFEAPIAIEQREVYVTPSIGITFYPLDDSTTEALLRNADTAMYKAKELGGDGVQFFTQDLNDRAAERLALENSLRQAMARDEFELHYQPRVCAGDGAVVGVEALLRWTHPELGRVSPERFIPVLEDTGQIDAVGAWVLREACRESMAWRAAGLPPVRVAVNISPRQMRSGDLVSLVDQVLAETGLPASGLELEITESVMVESVEDTAATLRTLADRGVHIALDDFGTGYSALGYLRRFHIDTLKIDRSFINEVPENADDARVASALVAIAGSLGLRVTAEGVETAEQLAFLRGLGCDEVQGFLFSPPLSATDFRDWLAAENHQPPLARPA